MIKFHKSESIIRIERESEIKQGTKIIFVYDSNHHKSPKLLENLFGPNTNWNPLRTQVLLHLTKTVVPGF